MLSVAHSSLRPSEISSEAGLSSGNAKPLLGCPIHIKKTAILRTAQLETHQQRHCLQVTTNMPAILAVFKLIQQLFNVFVGFLHVDSVSDWNGWVLISIMQQERLEAQFRRVNKQSPFLRVIFDSEGVHQANYIVTEHKVIFLSEECTNC